MNNHWYLKVGFIFISTLVFLFLFPTPILAGEEHNVRGRALVGELNGQISNNDFLYFNCLDEPGDAFTYTFPFFLGGDPCAMEFNVNGNFFDNYGVHLDFEMLAFSGYARHKQYGLISFQDGVPDDDYSFVDHCPGASCDSSNDCSACYNKDSQRIHGWAKIINSGEWIELHHNEINSPQRAMVHNYNASGNYSPGDFGGKTKYEDWGEIRFNCHDVSGWSCSLGDTYNKVFVWHIELASMSAPHWTWEQACWQEELSAYIKGLSATLEWGVWGGNIDRYDIVINTENDRNSPSAESLSFNSNEPGVNPRRITCRNTISDDCNSYLEYDQSYYWWIKIYDDQYERETDWVQFNHAEGEIGELTDNQTENDNNSSHPNLTFTTYQHDFPRPYFSWQSPAGELGGDIQVGTSTDFWVTDETKVYSTGQPIEGEVCNDDNCGLAWLWSYYWPGLGDGSAEIKIASSTSATTTIDFFDNLTGQKIILKATDSTGYHCTKEENVFVFYDLPLWREIKSEEEVGVEE